MDLTQFVRLGIASSQVERFATENLNEEQAAMITQTYNLRVQSHIKNSDSYALTLEEKMQKLGIAQLHPKYNHFYATAPDIKSSGTIREAAFQLFSKLDPSTNERYQKSFAEALQKYSTLQKGANDHFSPTPTEYQDATAMFYRIQFGDNGALQVMRPVNEYA